MLKYRLYFLCHFIMSVMMSNEHIPSILFLYICVRLLECECVCVRVGILPSVCITTTSQST